MDVKLYVIPGSHPAMTIRRMLELKGVDYKRVDLMPVVSKGVLRVIGFPSNTIPAAKINGRKVQGSREIARELDLLAPEPPLYPPEGPEREAVETAERWGDEVLQAPIRRMSWNAFKRDRAPMESFSKGARLGVPVGFAVKTGGPLVAAAAKLNNSTDENVRDDVAALPGMVQRVDDWIEAGVIGGEHLNAADLQIGGSLRLAMAFDDLLPAFEGHPAGALAMRAIPDYPGHIPPIFPAEWLEPLKRPATA